MGAFTNLWHSEKGMIAILILVAMTVFVITGHATLDQWQDLALPLFGVYAGAKTVDSVGKAVASAMAVKGGAAAAVAPPPDNAPKPVPISPP